MSDPAGSFETLAFVGVMAAAFWVLWPKSGKLLGSVKCRAGGVLLGGRELQVRRTKKGKWLDAKVVLRIGSSPLGSALPLEDASRLADILDQAGGGLRQGAVRDLAIGAASDEAGDSRVEIAQLLEDDNGMMVRFAWATLDPSQARALVRLLRKAAVRGE